MEIVKKNHIGAYGLIIKNDSIALIRKARGGYKGLLDLPGGGIEHNETPVEGLKRELLEEAGVTVTNYQLLTATSRTFSWQESEKRIEDLHHFGILYKVDILEDVLKNDADGLDSLGCQFYEIKKLCKKDVTPFANEGLELLGYHLK